MLTLFAKKNVSTNVALDNTDELTAIETFARLAGEKLAIDAQNLKSGFLASAAQGSTILADRVVVLHGSSEAIDTPQTMVATFDQPVTWNNDASQQVDYVIGVVMPNAAGETDYADIVARIKTVLAAHAAALGDLKGKAGQLNKLRLAFTPAH